MKLWLAAMLLAAGGTAGAMTVVSTIGDQDGFGIGVTDGASFDAELIGAGDGDGTDELHDGSLTFVHDYVLPPGAVSASLELFSGGFGLDGASSLFLNGSFVGLLSDGDNSDAGPVFNHAFKDDFDLTPFIALLTGHDSFEIRPIAGEDDAGVLDYSRLSIATDVVTTIPEPSTYALFAIGLGTLLLTRRRSLSLPFQRAL